MQKRVYIAGEKIFQEGELGEELYILSNGLVGIYKAGVKLGELGEKEVFGEMAIIETMGIALYTMNVVDDYAQAMQKAKVLWNTRFDKAL